MTAALVSRSTSTSISTPAHSRRRHPLKTNFRCRYFWIRACKLHTRLAIIHWAEEDIFRASGLSGKYSCSFYQSQEHLPSGHDARKEGYIDPSGATRLTIQDAHILYCTGKIKYLITCPSTLTRISPIRLTRVRREMDLLCGFSPRHLFSVHGFCTN